MQTKQTPDPNCSPVRLLASYVDEFERWMQSSGRCRNSREADDVRQEIRLAFWELRDTPATPDEARLIFLRLASRFASRSKRQIHRQGALVYDPDGFAEKFGKLTSQYEANAVQSLALLNALEKLDDQQRWFIIECKFKERSNVDVGKELGLSDDIVRNRLWRAITQLLAILKDKDETPHGEKKERGALIAPLMFEFTDDQCAAFWSIWKAEGRLPTHGGPPGPPPNPPREFRWMPRFSSPHAPKYIAAIGGGVGGLGGLGALLFFLFGSPHSSPELTRFGVHDHFPVEAFGTTTADENTDSVTAADSSPFPNKNALSDESNDVAVTQASPVTSSPTSVPASSSPPVDPDEIKRARRRVRRFLPPRQ